MSTKETNEKEPVRERTKSMTETVRKSLGRLQSIKLPKFAAPKVPKVTGGFLPKRKKTAGKEKAVKRVAAPELPETFPEEFILWGNYPAPSMLKSEVLDEAKKKAEAMGYVPADKAQWLNEAYTNGEDRDKAMSLLSAVGVGKFNRLLGPLLDEEVDDAPLGLLGALPGCKLVITNSVMAPKGKFNWYTNETLAKSGLAIERMPKGSILQVNGTMAEPSSLNPAATPASETPDVMEFIKEAFAKYPVVFLGGEFKEDDLAVEILKDLAVAKEEDDNVRRNIALVPVGDGKPEELDIDCKFLEYTPDAQHTQLVEFLAKIATRKPTDELVLGTVKYLPIESEFDPLPYSKAVFKWDATLPTEWLRQEMESIAVKDDLCVRILVNDAALDSITAENKGEYQSVIDFIAKHGVQKLDVRVTKSEGVSDLFFFKKKTETGIQHGIVTITKTPLVEGLIVKKIDVNTEDVLKQVARFEENWVGAKDAVPYFVEAISKLPEPAAEEPEVAEDAKKSVKEDTTEAKKEEALKKKEEVAKKKEEAKKLKEEAAKKKAEEKKQKKEEAAKKKEEAKKLKEEALKKKAEEKKLKKEEAAKKKKEESAKSAEETPAKEEEKPAAEATA